MCIHVVGILFQRLLRQGGGIGGTVEGQVQFGELLIGSAGLGVGFEGVLIILNGLERLFLIALRLRHQRVQPPHGEVVVRGGAVVVRRGCGARVRSGQGLRERDRYECAYKGERFG